MSENAGTIMTSPVTTINKNATLQDAIEVIAKSEFSGLLVTDDNSVLVGVLSETDIIKYSNKENVVPLMSLTGWVSPHTAINDIAMIHRGVDLLKSTKVKSVMTRKVVSAKKETPASEVAQIMSKKNINRLPVIDENDCVVGIITRSDLIRGMAKNL